jgi:hypothetical protein
MTMYWDHEKVIMIDSGIAMQQMNGLMKFKAQ